MLIHVKSDVQREDEANNNGIEEDDSEEEDDDTPPRLDVSWLTHPVFSVEQIILLEKLVINCKQFYILCLLGMKHNTFRQTCH